MRDDRMIRSAPDGSKWVLQDKFLRITQNPVAPRYPKTGDTIKLKGHGLIPDGEYVVELVTEFEPGINRDEDGRDIRIGLLGTGDPLLKGLNGYNIRLAMAQERIDRLAKKAIP
jgi:hypothetical protein